MNLNALYKLGYGMYIIASPKGDGGNGQVANTLFQITAEPPTVAVSINKQNLRGTTPQTAPSYIKQEKGGT